MRNSLPNLSKDTSAYRVTILIQTTSMRSTSLQRIIMNIFIFLKTPMVTDRTWMMITTLWPILTLIHTLFRIVKFLKRGKAPYPYNIHNEVLRLGTTTSFFHHLARLFTSSIQIGYIPTAWKLATLHMLLKPDKLPSLTISYMPISLMSSIMKLFERVIEQRLRSYLEDIGFINKYQSGFRQNKSTDDHLHRISKSVI